MTLTRTYTKYGETPNTFKYKNDENERDTLYIQKADAKEIGNPDRVQVSIEAAE